MKKYLRTKLSRVLALVALLVVPGIIHAQSWGLIGITGQKADDTPDGQGGFLYPDNTYYSISTSSGAITKLFKATFAPDSHSIGYCPTNGLLYHTGGSQAYRNDPCRTGTPQGSAPIRGLAFQDNQFMEAVNLATHASTGVYNANSCPNPGDPYMCPAPNPMDPPIIVPGLPCFGVPAPFPTWVEPQFRRNSDQTGGENNTRGPNEFGAARGLAWSTSSNLFYLSDDEGIFKMTTSGDCTFLARPAFPTTGQNNQSKAIAFVTVGFEETALWVGHKEGSAPNGYIMKIDPATGDVLPGELVLNYPPGGGEPVGVFGGLVGLAQHPVTEVIYGIRNPEADSTNVLRRELVTIDPATGDTTLVGNMGMHIASMAFAQIEVGEPGPNGLTPRTATFDVNTNQNNTSTESLGVGIVGNGNVLIAWEDDALVTDVTYWGATWTLYDGNGALLTPAALITSVSPGDPCPPAGGSITTTYRSFYRSDGTPTPSYAAWGPKIKPNLFGNGIGMGGSADALACEISEFFATQVDAGGSGDFPAVQLLNNDGSRDATVGGPVVPGIVSFTDADAEPAGNIRIGDWERLANGNFVIVGESRQDDDRALTGQPSGNTPIYRVVSSTGAEVKGLTAVSSEPVGSEMWHGVGVTANGFAVRINPGGVAHVRLFDNAGNPTTTNINLATLTGNPAAGGGGRGDGAGFHGNGTDAYVHVNSGAGGPWVTVINANGTLRWSRSVAEDFETISSERVDAAIAPDGRVVAVWDDITIGTTFTNRFPQARLFSASGTPLGSKFWLSERDQPPPGGSATLESRRPRVSLRNNCVAVIWESLNSPATFSRVVAGRIFNITTQPVITSIVDNGATVTIKWLGGGPTWSVQCSPTVTGFPTAPIATALTTQSYTTPKTGSQQFYVVTSP